MKRIIKKSLVLMICLLFLSGCWDQKNIQDIHYVTTFGVDYKDGKYIVYVQLIDFAGVAKQEVKPTTPSRSYIGHNSGKTITEAINNLYKTAQQRLFLGHVHTFILTENALKQDINDIIDAAFRNNFIRYSSNFFVTKKPLDELLKITGFFNLSPMYSELHFPDEVYRNRSFIRPITIQEFIAKYREAAVTAIVPSITWNAKDWKDNTKKKLKTFTIDGAYTLFYNKSKPWYSEEELAGVRWMTKNTTRTPVDIQTKDGFAYFSMAHPKTKIKPIIEGNQAKFIIHCSVSGRILGLTSHKSIKALEKSLKSSIAHDIRKTFEVGLRNNADPLNLGGTLYRKELRFWQAHHFNEPNDYLHRDALQAIHIDVKLANTGILKARPFKDTKILGK
ncbi:Ger(x)C family spore germination protein [Peribacillus asahii]|uniref:Ger(x)C family spore germination protein n=1 Tax=Peribacillus asahii TaxID=228899 RepID=UPI00207AA813|nr:Ger(x)C family spore germination protein [Peribacillus asahii]USK69068.1 Ger(x)C family spore germination protein [Peribacillus asahii]